MTKFWLLWVYISQFWSVTVLNCARPVNWGNCWPPHEWLVPAISDLWRARQPYKTERDLLKSLEAKQ